MLEFVVEVENNYEQLQSSKVKIVNKRWDGGKNLFLLLYTYIRVAKPKVVVETGVANGVSTNAIMNAMKLNQNNGVLHSFDILPQTKEAYKGKGLWEFHLLRKPYKKNLLRTVDNFGEVDLWIHDSNHSYLWQNMDYELALSKLSNRGTLISDDIDASLAWSQKSKTNFKTSYILNDYRKFIGIAFSKNNTLAN
jgi:predicted O-methyltransferase YrrM